MRGRKPKPPELRILEGAKGASEAPGFVAGLPKCPSHLDTEAKAEWKRVTAQLEAAGVLAGVDRAALAIYCHLWGRWVALSKRLSEEGEYVEEEKVKQFTNPRTNQPSEVREKTGRVIVNPAVRIVKDVAQQLLAYATEFGLTASSRSRLTGLGKGKAGKVMSRRRA